MPATADGASAAANSTTQPQDVWNPAATTRRRHTRRAPAQRTIIFLIVIRHNPTFVLQGVRFHPGAAIPRGSESRIRSVRRRFPRSALRYSCVSSVMRATLWRRPSGRKICSLRISTVPAHLVRHARLRRLVRAENELEGAQIVQARGVRLAAVAEALHPVLLDADDALLGGLVG